MPRSTIAMLAAPAADDDDEGAGHSSEYLQHFAHYLSNRNFPNLTSDNVNDFAAMSEQLPPPPAEAWTAEFDLEDLEADPSPGAAPAAAGADGTSGGSTSGLGTSGLGISGSSTFSGGDDDDDFDDDAPSLRASAGSGATTDSLSAEGVSSSGAAGGVNLNASWAAEFETPSSSTANADGSDDDGWAAFDTAPATGPVDSETDAPAAAESGRSSQGDPDLAI